MTDPGVQTPKQTTKPPTATNLPPMNSSKGRLSTGKPAAVDPQKLMTWGISGDQTDPIYLLSQLKKHVNFRNPANKLVTAIAPLEEAFIHITDALLRSLTDQSEEMSRLTNSEKLAKTQTNAAIDSLQASLVGEIQKSQEFLANLIKNQPTTTYAEITKPGSERDHMPSRPPNFPSPPQFQITIKSSKIDPNHPILSADTTNIVKAFNTAVTDTISANDSNLLTPITARGARRLKSGDFAIILRSQEDVELIRNNSAEWLPRFAPGAWTSIPKYSVVINGVPATFDTTSELDIRRLEDNNPDVLLPYSISRVRWLRKPKSDFASLVADIRDSQSANQAIDNGLSSDYSLLSVHKLTDKIIQCYKCQKYGHMAKFCKEPDRCALCAGEHPTNSCELKQKHTHECESNCLHSKRTCSNCTGTHATFDRDCPVRIIERARIDAKPGNAEPYFAPYLGPTTWSEGITPKYVSKNHHN
ncbi:hypothetical protein R3P38DRAFT_1410433 [Favolaschia claudopus]|uniref:CCHC-type domain-containing protein n=1 Tax=Favolaschia claudopus TaxID=2862362 RepID=A0AAW0AS55_9AGAR